MAQRRVAVVLFRNDLRLHDNPALSSAASSGCTHLVPLFLWDNDGYHGPQAKTWNFKLPRSSHLKRLFLAESLSNLKSSLRSLNSDLIVISSGDPAAVIKAAVANFSSSTSDVKVGVWMAKEYTWEEQRVEKQLQRHLPPSIKLHLVDSRATAVSLDQLPLPNVGKLPDVYTEFRVLVESARKRGAVVVNNLLPSPTRLPPLPPPSALIKDELESILNSARRESGTPDPRSSFPFKGGETAALQRLKEYMANGVPTYKQTRNGLLGTEYSTKFSPWLALGCISPKRIIQQLESDQRESSADGIYWVWFELLWRDYFKFVALKFGSKLFLESGLSNSSTARSWHPDHNDTRFKAWCTGTTGVPFVDANMRELAATGFMSNRGRQNVASFLVKDLQLDWRKGAEWFESQLIDHDPCSNYGNWLYVAGLGNDPRGSDRYFNMIKQARDYDPEAKYVLTWCPELMRTVSQSVLYHTPWMDPSSTYPRPLVMGKGWDRYSDGGQRRNDKTRGNRRERVKLEGR